MKYLVQDLRGCERHREWHKNNHFLIVSYPRSGSHWTRRMLGEITAIRSGMSAKFGKDLSRTAGFHAPALNDDGVLDWQTPFFSATHAFVDRCQIYLRRNWPDVYKSNLKAMAEHRVWAWDGTDEQMYNKWADHVEHHCRVAEVVLDYEVIRADPAIVVRLAGKMANLNLTEDEVQRAVAAGSRENMLKEQAESSATWNVINEEEEKCA